MSFSVQYLLVRFILRLQHMGPGTAGTQLLLNASADLPKIMLCSM